MNDIVQCVEIWSFLWFLEKVKFQAKKRVFERTVGVSEEYAGNYLNCLKQCQKWTVLFLVLQIFIEFVVNENESD